MVLFGWFTISMGSKVGSCQCTLFSWVQGIAQDGSECNVSWWLPPPYGDYQKISWNFWPMLEASYIHKCTIRLWRTKLSLKSGQKIMYYFYFLLFYDQILTYANCNVFFFHPVVRKQVKYSRKIALEFSQMGCIINLSKGLIW